MKITQIIITNWKPLRGKTDNPKAYHSGRTCPDRDDRTSSAPRTPRSRWCGAPWLRRRRSGSSGCSPCPGRIPWWFWGRKRTRKADMAMQFRVVNHHFTIIRVKAWRLVVWVVHQAVASLTGIDCRFPPPFRGFSPSTGCRWVPAGSYCGSNYPSSEWPGHRRASAGRRSTVAENLKWRMKMTM